MKVKLEFTLNLALKANACESGVNKLLDYFKVKGKVLKPSTKVNLLTLLESNGIHDTLWALRCTNKSSKSISIEVSKRAAARAAGYVDAAARAAGYAAEAAARAAGYAAEAAGYAAEAAGYAAEAAARAAGYAARAAGYAAEAAGYAAGYAACAERKKQKQDLLELLEADKDFN